MKTKTKILFCFCLIVLSVALIGQVVTESASKTIVTQRWLSDVQINIDDDGSAKFIGRVSKRTLDGTNTIRSTTVRMITLSGAKLDTALATAGLPTETQILNRFRNLFHAAYTNEMVATGQAP